MLEFKWNRKDELGTLVIFPIVCGWRGKLLALRMPSNHWSGRLKERVYCRPGFYCENVQFAFKHNDGFYHMQSKSGLQ